MNTAAFALACAVLLSESEPCRSIMVSIAVVSSDARNSNCDSTAIRARQEQKDVVSARSVKQVLESG